MNFIITIVECGITMVLFILLFSLTNAIMASAINRSNALLDGIHDFNENPQKLEEELEKTDLYMGELTSTSIDFLDKIVNSIDESLLSREDAEYLREVKEFLKDKKTSDEITLDDVKEIEERLDRIYRIMEKIEAN